MKTSKILQVSLAIVASLISFTGCSNSSSQSQKEEPFWEGVVKPGTYNISWRETSAYGENANKVSLEISIFDNREYEIREKTECGLARIYHSSIEVMEGTMEKKREIYNGREIVWFTFPYKNVGYSVTPSGDFYDVCFHHWQDCLWIHDPVGKIH